MIDFTDDVWRPNIEGRFGYSAYVFDDEITGAFEQYGNDKEKFPVTNSSGTQIQLFSFDASLCSDLYDEHGSIQVPALQVLTCIKT